MSETSEQRRVLSITSVVLGILAIPTGYLLVVPIAGIIVGVIAKGREPHATRIATVGIGLSVAGLILGFLLVTILGTAPLGLVWFEVNFDLG